MLSFVPDMKGPKPGESRSGLGRNALCVRDGSCQLFFPDERGRMQPAW